MAFENLCTIQDIKTEYRNLPSTLNSAITKKIPGATIETYQDANITITPTDETILYNLKMACVYRILMWLEQGGDIDGTSSNVASMSDGDFSVSFNKQASQSSSENPKTYEQWYNYYITKTKGSVPVGSSRYYEV